MEVEKKGPVMRAHDNTASPAKKASPTKVNKTVSAAAVFGKHKNKTNRGVITPSRNKSNLEFTDQDAEATTVLSVKSHSSSRSPEKRVSKKRPSDMHPLSIAFKNTSTDYRRHLYKTTSLKINKTLQTLLHTLHESTLQTIPSAPNQPDASTSPLRLSAPAKYERLAQQLHLPISQFTLSLRRTNSQGQSVRFEQTLETRMRHYGDLVSKQTEKVAQLQQEWEAVVGEIWKLGGVCLGEDMMRDLLFTEQQQKQGAASTFPSSSPSPPRPTDAESTLFMPEHGGTSPLNRKVHATKKHVSFVEQSLSTHYNDKYGASPISAFPTFLYQASRYALDAVNVVSAVPEERISAWETQVQELGSKEMEGFRDLESEYRAFWKRKTAKLASALKDE